MSGLGIRSIGLVTHQLLLETHSSALRFSLLIWKTENGALISGVIVKKNQGKCMKVLRIMANT